MLATVFLLSYKTIQPKKYTLIWSLVFALSAIKGVINAINSTFTDRELYWILINAFSLLLQWLTWAGFRLRANRSPFEPKVLTALILIELLLIYFTIFSPHIGYRMMLIPIFGGLMMFLCSWEIFNSHNKTRPAEAAAIVIFALYGLTQITAGIISLMQGAEINAYYLDMYRQVNLLFMPAAFTGMGLFTLLILVDDIGVKLKNLAITDSLTQVLNRRGFYQKAKLMLEKFTHKNTWGAVIITDIDNFKKINDQYGHHAGDKALISFSNHLSNSFNDDAIVGRIGGEEFVIFVVDNSINEQFNGIDTLVENCRKNLQHMDIQHEKNIFKLTASFGITEFLLSNTSIEESLRKADQALYEAKNNGRNCTVNFKNSTQGDC